MFNIELLIQKKLINDFEIIGYNEFSFNLINQKDISGIDTSMIDFSKYRFKVKLSKRLPPELHMLTPSIRKDCPHLNFDESLCLFHIDEFKENSSLCLKYIDKYRWFNSTADGDRIILILYTWVLYYDLWLRHKVWYGDEFPHI